MSRYRTAWLMAGILTGFWLLANLLRPAIPVDETRYLSLAWGMRERGDGLLLYLNGLPYADKPPVLFWLINAAWGLFGVGLAQARLVAVLASALGLWLTARLARRLWPGESGLPGRAAWVLLGSLYWLAFSSALMFDLWLSTAAIAALLALAQAPDRPQAWWGVGLALGLGLLIKGPVIFLFLLPAAWVAPWWLGQTPVGGWRAWYGRSLLAILLAIALALAWAVPAAIRGGETFARAIFWGQTAGRMVHAFAHARPFGWYLPLLPLMAFPWLFMPSLWKGMTHLSLDRGTRFCLAVFLPGLVLMNLVSGKQPHYLLPLFPVLALLLARALPERLMALDRWVLAGVLLTLALAAAWAGFSERIPVLMESGFRAGLILAGAALGLFLVFGLAGERPLLAVGASLVLLAWFHLTVLPSLGAQLDLVPAAVRVAEAERGGRSIAVLGEYEAELDFLGRLTKPLQRLSREELTPWSLAHPDGMVVLIQKRPLQARGAQYRQAYRDESLELWPAAELAAVLSDQSSMAALRR